MAMASYLTAGKQLLLATGSAEQLVTMTVFSAFQKGHDCHSDMFQTWSDVASRHFVLQPRRQMIGFVEDADWDRIDMFHFIPPNELPNDMAHAFIDPSKKCYRKLWVSWGPDVDASIPYANPTWLEPFNNTAVTRIADERKLYYSESELNKLFIDPVVPRFMVNLVRHREFAIDGEAQQTDMPGKACASAFHGKIFKATVSRKQSVSSPVPYPFGAPIFIQKGSIALGVTSDFSWTVALVSPFATAMDVWSSFVGNSLVARMCRTSCVTCLERHLVLDSSARTCPRGDLGCRFGSDLHM